MYNLQGNDDCIVSFSREELNYCEYPRSIFIDHEGDLEAEGDIVMPIPYLNGSELEVFREFLRGFHWVCGRRASGVGISPFGELASSGLSLRGLRGQVCRL